MDTFKLTLIPFAALVIAVAVPSCSEEVAESAEISALSLETIDSQFEMGRVLFYDKNLSINSSVSCGSCHKQELAFADNKQFSVGFENRLTERNTPPIQNLSSGLLPIGEASCIDNGFDVFCDTRTAGSLFWDGRESDLRAMVLQPVVNHREMGIKDMDNMLTRLENTGYYTAAARTLYGSEILTEEIVSDALAVFVGSIRTFGSTFERHVATGEALSALETTGKDLFFDKYECNSCHQVETPNGYQFSIGGAFLNIGLDPVYDDVGVMNITGVGEDAGSFKTPSLRNVELTGPYMHDGRFATLDEVLDHYSTGVADNENLDFRLKTSDGAPKVFNITEQEKKAIIAFLKTLTDWDMVTDPAFSNPFVTR